MSQPLHPVPWWAAVFGTGTPVRRSEQAETKKPGSWEAAGSGPQGHRSPSLCVGLELTAHISGWLWIWGCGLSLLALAPVVCVLCI